MNLAGLPGISVPVGTDSKGLPVGMQFIGNCFEENKIIRAAFSLEQTLADMGVKGGKALWPEGMIR